MTSFMKSVAAAMMDPMQQKPYKESSVKPLMIYLRKLAGGDFDNLDFLMNKKAIDEKLGAYAESTQRTIVFSINNVAKAMKREDIVKLYGKDVVAATKHRNPVGEKTEKQKENWITWEQVIAARDALKEKNTEEAERQYVALSLYTMAPPRRNRDYLEMDVVSRMNKKKTDRNLLVMNKKSMRFVFNQFKTADVYGQQVVKVPKDLEAVAPISRDAYGTAGSFVRDWPELQLHDEPTELCSWQECRILYVASCIRVALHHAGGQGNHREDVCDGRCDGSLDDDPAGSVPQGLRMNSLLQPLM